MTTQGADDNLSSKTMGRLRMRILRILRNIKEGISIKEDNNHLIDYNEISLKILLSKTASKMITNLLN